MLPDDVIDLAEVVTHRIHDMGYDDAKIRRIADITKGGIAVIRGRSVPENTYFDGSRDLMFPIRIVVSREKYADALKVASKIADKMPNADLSSENGSYRLTSSAVDSQPQEIDQMNGCHIFELNINCQITTF